MAGNNTLKLFGYLAAASFIFLSACFVSDCSAAEVSAATAAETTATPAQKTSFKPDLGQLVNELQRSYNDTHNIALALWFPEEYWKAALEENDSLTEESREEFLSALRPYTLFVVTSGRMGMAGGVSYDTEKDIRADLSIVCENGQVLRPLEKSEIDPDVVNVMSMVMPVISNMLGEFGDNCCLVAFSNKAADGGAVLNPLKPGTFTVKMGDIALRWKLPLNALMAPKTCPKCKEECSGAWEYCPWDGTRLTGTTM